MTPYRKFDLVFVLDGSAVVGSQSPPLAADNTQVGDIEVPTLGPAQDPLGIKTAAAEFPCGGLRPALGHPGATERASPHYYAIPIGTRMENSAWKVDKGLH